jgi:hypothetical protein
MLLLRPVLALAKATLEYSLPTGSIMCCIVKNLSQPNTAAPSLDIRTTSQSFAKSGRFDF